MAPQEKADELVNKFYNVIGKNYSKGDGFGTQLFEEAKQCALIAIDEILHSLEYNTWQNREILKYYEEVKQEIEKL
jgi:hypothetical protein